MSGAALTHRGKGLAPSPRGGLPLFTTLFTKLATRHVLAILNTIPAISKRVRGNIRILCSNDCLCLSRSLGSLICCLVGSVIFNTFSRSPSSALRLGSFGFYCSNTAKRRDSNYCCPSTIIRRPRLLVAKRTLLREHQRSFRAPWLSR
jgi:hypothetical protein